MDSIIGIFGAEILGLSLFNLVLAVLLIIFGVLFYKYRKLAKDEKGFIETFIVKLVQDNFGKLKESVDNEELEKIIKFVKEEYIKSPVETEKEVLEEIEKEESE